MLPGLSAIGGFVGRLLAYTYSGFLEETAGVSNTWTFSAVDFGAADSTRCIVVSITANGSTAKTVTSVTIGGVSATIIKQQSSSDWTGAIAAAIVPSGASGDVVVNLSGNSASCTIGVYRILGLSSAAGIDSDSSASGGR